MTDEQIYDELFSGGNYSLPYLVHFTDTSAGNIYLVNANADVTFNKQTYKSSSFTFTEPDYKGSGASLKMSLADNDLLVFIDKATDNAEVEITGVILEDGNIQELKNFSFSHFSAQWGSDMTLSLSFSTDDRMEMTFPPYVFDSDNNRGGE